MTTPVHELPALLPYEWPGTYLSYEEERANVLSVLEARSPFRFYGPDPRHYCDQLEAAYRARLGRKHTLAVNSGTSALSICMAALDLGPGDEVLIPGYFWVSCAAAVVRAGAIPRLVEIDESFVLDPLDFERKIGPRSKAVLVVHMGGATGDLDRILELARAHGLAVIEDVAQANGGRYRGRPLGSFGDLAIFSFQLNKIITAGEGGLIVCDDERLYQRAFALHDLGYARNAEGRLITEDPDLQLWGQGSRMNELSAAMLVAQERKLNTLVGAMHRSAEQLKAGLAGVAGLELRRVGDPEGDCGCFVMLIWPNTDICLRMTQATREAGVRPGPKGASNIPLSYWGMHLYYNNPSLVNRRGLHSGGFPWTHPDNAFAAVYRYDQGTLPRSDDLFGRSSILAVPPSLSEETCAQVITAFRQCARQLGL